MTLDPVHVDGIAQLAGQVRATVETSDQGAAAEAVWESFLDPLYDTDGREPILRAAQRRGCTVEFVGGNDRLDRVGGVGCLLRYRPPSMTLDSPELRTVEGGN